MHIYIYYIFIYLYIYYICIYIYIYPLPQVSRKKLKIHNFCYTTMKANLVRLLNKYFSIRIFDTDIRSIRILVTFEF